MSSPVVHSNPADIPGSVHKRSWRVLIVDDDPSIIEIIEAYLRRQKNYEVLKASNALEALALLDQAVDVDVVFVDINMPGMSGIEFVEKLKARDRTIVAAIITGEPSMDVIVKAMRSGASDFLSKPFKFDQLQVALERLLKERSILVENQFLTEEVRVKRLLEQLNDKLARKMREQEILFTISECLSRTRNSEELYQILVELCAKLADASNSMLWIKEEDRHSLILVASCGEIDEELTEISFDSHSHPVIKVIRDGIPVLGENPVSPQKTDSDSPSCRGCYLLVPFRIREEIIGVLGVSDPDMGMDHAHEPLFLLHILSERASLTVENILLYDTLFMNLHATLRALVRSLEAKDPYTKLHSERVTQWAVEIAKKMGCSEEEIESLTFAGHLHDIGKIGIRDQILMKPGRLTDEEYEIIKTHPVIGAEIVGHLGLLQAETSIIRHHHERWDGKGYPDGLKEKEIPKLSRILAVADTYDAITSRRPYRDAKSDQFALDEIVRNSGTQFDPHVVDAFVLLMKDQMQEGHSEGKEPESTISTSQPA